MSVTRANMKKRRARQLRSVGLAAALAVTPSIGTQGMGTFGDRFVHPDNQVFTAGAGGRHERDLLLRRTDLFVERQVEALVTRDAGLEESDRDPISGPDRGS